MATDSANAVGWYLAINKAHSDYLGALRACPGLQVGFEEELIWVTGFAEDDLKAVAIQCIPHKWLYYSEGGRLFPRGSRLPARTLPALLWSPIQGALPLELPTRNYNFFGLFDSLSLTLQPSGIEQTAMAMLLPMTELATYVETAPAVRLQRLQWVVLANQALLIGTPLLPLPGTSFWSKYDWLLPTGFNTEFPILDEQINTRLNPAGTDWLLWHSAGTYLRVAKTALMPLSISSFRATIRS